MHNFSHELSCSSALKTGGTEIAREKWDEAEVKPDEEDPMDLVVEIPKSPHSILPDWTRSPLPTGAPMATRLQPLSTPQPQALVTA